MTKAETETGRRDVELRCDSCSKETLATDGCWSARCRCGGARRVFKAHDHVLTPAEATALGYGLLPL